MLKTYKGIRRDYTGKTNEDGDVAYVEDVNKWLNEQAASPETPQADVTLNDLLVAINKLASHMGDLQKVALEANKTCPNKKFHGMSESYRNCRRLIIEVLESH